jgi:hypothetical protein
LSRRLQTTAWAVVCFGLFASRSEAQLGLPPKITVQPTNTTVSIGGKATFAIEAYSLLPMSYKWYRNGVEVSGADQSTYTDDNAQSSDAGSYYVKVSNLVGSDESRTATLTIIYPPVRFDSAEMRTNGFKMTLSGPSATFYVLLASSDLTNWTAIGTNSAVTGSTVFTDTTAKNRAMRFYRAVAR